MIITVSNRQILSFRTRISTIHLVSVMITVFGVIMYKLLRSDSSINLLTLRCVVGQQVKRIAHREGDGLQFVTIRPTTIRYIGIFVVYSVWKCPSHPIPVFAVFVIKQYISLREAFGASFFFVNAILTCEKITSSDQWDQMYLKQYHVTNPG